ncbi:Crp/Fnr family transcriptional regulator [Bacillota bacterium Meth-B3]|nr:Crp/Fnr family transcriptional regulator [Christensenellaceae bacterium]MEA5065497.1 Crp/Fnr family transcriptional regulator [Eubacteriales bacterium]MEA5070055.1 Crp/Fnr family transcriptional regulator [Christensenellaceae bacterium]
MAFWMTSEQIDLFTPEVDALLAVHGRHISHAAKTVFLSPGMTIEGIYYLHSGRTRHSVVNEDGNTKLLYTLRPGYYFGEASYYLHAETSLISETETDVVFYHLAPDVLKRLLAESEAFRHSLLMNYSTKLMVARYEISNLSFSSTKERLMRFFCSVADTKHPIDPSWYPLIGQYNQTEIGEIIGVTRVTVNRNLTELCAEGELRIIKTRTQVHRTAYERYRTQPLY